MRSIICFSFLAFAIAIAAEDFLVLDGFRSEDAAKARSAAAMAAEQTQKTRDDPKTITRYLWERRQDQADTNNWALLIPATETNKLATGERLVLKPRGTNWTDKLPEVLEPAIKQLRPN